jgi:hypothetical protein
MYCGMIVCDPDRALCRLRDRIDRGGNRMLGGLLPQEPEDALA